MTKLSTRLVYKVEGGYQVQVHNNKTGQFEAEGKGKVYFHPTSAYAAMGRLVHNDNVKALSLESDPAKAPAKEPAAK